MGYLRGTGSVVPINYGKKPYTETIAMRRQINSMKMQIRGNKPEIKVRQLVAAPSSVAVGTAVEVDLTAIQQGDDSTNRSGRRINIKGFSIHTHPENRGIDIYLIKSGSGIAPTYASFQPVRQGHLTDETHHDFKIVKYLKPLYNTNYTRFVKRFKAPQYVYYQTAANNTGYKNTWHLVFKNDTNVAADIEYSVNVYYTDA